MSDKQNIHYAEYFVYLLIYVLNTVVWKPVSATE